MISEEERRRSSTSREYFDSLGAAWDGLRSGFFSEAVRDRALEAAAVEPGRLAVDVGAGTGFMTQGLVAQGLRVIAVDQSSVMLGALSRKLSDSHSIECRVGDAEILPVADSFADYGFANMLLHHVERPSVAIRELARVVVPSGRVVVTDLDAHTHEFLRTEHRDRWMGFTREEVRRWFQDAGLSDVQVEGIGQNCSTRSCEGRLAVVSIFLAIGTVPESRTL